ncbi:hypothetical protein IT396_02350 [Candidatus Nomurabacteria bacterium]|nr:hypothetical protein [Candidatus Nomurabacteria bacterium]
MNRDFNFSKRDWNQSKERKELLEKIRTFKPNDRVIVSGAYGTVASIDENTLTVNVSAGKGKALPYNVSVVNKG